MILLLLLFGTPRVKCHYIIELYRSILWRIITTLLQLLCYVLSSRYYFAPLLFANKHKELTYTQTRALCCLLTEFAILFTLISPILAPSSMWSCFVYIHARWEISFDSAAFAAVAFIIHRMYEAFDAPITLINKQILNIHWSHCIISTLTSTTLLLYTEFISDWGWSFEGSTLCYSFHRFNCCDCSALVCR